LANHCGKVAAFAVELQEMLKQHHCPEAAGMQAASGCIRVRWWPGSSVRANSCTISWGDSVNTASRMESHGEAGKIQVTREVWEGLKDTFSFSKAREMEREGQGSDGSVLFDRCVRDGER
jgi:hypothetical protein